MVSGVPQEKPVAHHDKQTCGPESSLHELIENPVAYENKQTCGPESFLHELTVLIHVGCNHCMHGGKKKKKKKKNIFQ